MNSEYIKLDEFLAIYKLKQSKNWYLRLRKNGQEFRKSLKTSDQLQATRKAYFIAEASNENVETEYLSKPSQEISTICRNVLKNLEKEINKIESENTKKNRNKDLLRYKRIYSELCEKFSKTDIKNFDYTCLLVFYKSYEREISSTQLSYINLAIKYIFEFALTNRLINVIPPLPKIKVKSAETGTYFNKNDYEKITKHFKSKKLKKGIATENRFLLEKVFRFITETGVRTGEEVTNIQYQDIKIESINERNYWTLKIKGGKRAEKDNVKRTIVISEEAMKIVKEIIDYKFENNSEIKSDNYYIKHLKDKKDIYLFKRKNGVTPDFSTLFSKFRKEISDELKEKDIVLYSCRHTFITNKLKKGANRNIIAKHCGTSIEMIERHYDHIISIMTPDELLDQSYKIDENIYLKSLNNDEAVIIDEINLDDIERLENLIES